MEKLYQLIVKHKTRVWAEGARGEWVEERQETAPVFTKGQAEALQEVFNSVLSMIDNKENILDGKYYMPEVKVKAQCNPFLGAVKKMLRNWSVEK